MKKLLSGNEAIARGSYEAGVRFATAYHGTPSTEILEELAKYDQVCAEWSINEKVALEKGIGAGLGGARSLVAMKHVGLNVASDPFMILAYTGVCAGIVIVSADDPYMHSSQSEQDNRNYAKFAKAPMLEPADSQEAKDFTKLAFDLSEKFDTPVMLRTTTRISHSKSVVELGERHEVIHPPFDKDVAKYVMIPVFARKRRLIMENRMQQIAGLVETIGCNRVEYNNRRLGIICSGIVYLYVKEVVPQASILKLGVTYPLPQNKIKEFCASVDKVYVIEELDPFLEEQIRAMGCSVIGKEAIPSVGELNPDIIADALGIRRKAADVSDKSHLPARPPSFCPGCAYRGVFYFLKKLKVRVMGDIGCYTLGALPPLEAIDAVFCMGASIGCALGFEKAVSDPDVKAVAVIGDSTFFHSGITALIDVIYNKGVGTVIVLDNHTTAMTGFQDHPGTGKTLKREGSQAVDLVKLGEAVGFKRVITFDPYDMDTVYKVLKEEIKREEPSLIISKRSCLLLDKKRKYQKRKIDAAKCNGCGVCLGLGCPALGETDNKKVKIEPVMCNGCPVCEYVCRQGAIESA